MNICDKCGKYKVDLTGKNKCDCYTSYASNTSIPNLMSINVSKDTKSVRYQEALKTFENIRETYGHYGVFDKPMSEVKKDYNLLQQAIDKANKYDEKETPKKVLKNTNYDNCPACYMPLVDYDKDDVTAVYCKYCGQKLD